MYDPCGTNQEQLNKLLDAIAVQREKLAIQQAALDDMMRDLIDVEHRARKALKSINAKTDLKA
jgi:hypothetical protein